jgi:hypothetical protein
MDGSLVWSNRHHQSGTMMPSGAVHPIIPGRAAGADPESRDTMGFLLLLDSGFTGFARAPE